MRYFPTPVRPSVPVPSISSDPTRALPHEWLFGGWLAAVALWLTAATGLHLAVTALFWTYALACPALVLWCARAPSPTRWRIRLLWYPSVMGLAFYSLPAAIAALGRPNADALLAGIDQHLLGAAVAERLAPIAQPVVTDVLLVAYLFFFVVLVFGPGYYCVKDLPRFRQCIVGLFSLYAIGFSGYVWLPAGGPYQFLSALPAMPLGPIATFMRPVIHGASNGVDVFPSIHFAASFYLLVFDYWHHRRRFWLWLAPISLLWLSTVYLRYHYLIDLVAGLAVAAFGLLIAALHARRHPLPTKQTA